MAKQEFYKTLERGEKSLLTDIEVRKKVSSRLCCLMDELEKFEGRKKERYERAKEKIYDYVLNGFSVRRKWKKE